MYSTAPPYSLLVLAFGSGLINFGGLPYIRVLRFCEVYTVLVL